MIISEKFDAEVLSTVSSSKAKSSRTKIKCKYDNEAETAVTELLMTENKDLY
jgi:hypothetical protein